MSDDRLGWSVAITRKDGTSFLAASERGILPPVWAHRKRAVAYKRELLAEGFKAKVVRVRFAQPEIVNPEPPHTGVTDEPWTSS